MATASMTISGVRLCMCGTPLAKRRRMCDECRERNRREGCKKAAAKWQSKNKRIVKPVCPLFMAFCPLIARNYGENSTAPFDVSIPRVLVDLERLKRLLERFVEGES